MCFRHVINIPLKSLFLYLTISIAFMMLLHLLKDFLLLASDVSNMLHLLAQRGQLKSKFDFAKPEKQFECIK